MTAPPSVPTAPAPRWCAPHALDEDRATALARALRLPALMGRALVVRGIEDPDAARALLRPLLTALHAPEALGGMDVAARRLSEAIRTGQTVLVHGDYDVDGIAATALLTRGLRRLGGRVEPFVPHRIRDGYDLGPSGVARALELGAALILTVDCGIVAHDAVASAVEAGLEVIVTDHHTPGPTLPAALAVVNPHRGDDGYPERVLCGAGVAFKLLQRCAELHSVALEALLPDLDLVALATVADLVPLTGENRVLVRYGLRALERTTKPGLQALKEVAGVAPGPVEAGQVGFRLAPRINALGRVADPAVAVQLLLTDDPAEARRLAASAEQANQVRRDEDARTLDEALARLAESFDPDRDFGVVVDGAGWHPGVIGIVASRVVDRIHRPVVVVARGDGTARGSGRSVPGFDLHAALVRCAPFLDRFGGHRQAAGLDLAPDRIPAFREAFNEVARDELQGRDLRPEIRADLEIDLRDVDLEVAGLLRHLGPHGIGHPRPVFLGRDLRVVGTPREVGTGHLKLTLEQGGARLPAIGFGLVERRAPADLVGRRVDALFQVTVNEFRGRRSAQLRLLDLRPTGETAP